MEVFSSGSFQDETTKKYDDYCLPLVRSFSFLTTCDYQLFYRCRIDIRHCRTIIIHLHIMNIFVTDPDPVKSAEVLPDKHIVKMPLETCQMLAVVYSKWYFNWGNDLLPKKDGTPYNTEKGAFRGHPCTIWAAESIANTAWLIQHGFWITRRVYT